MDGPSGTLQVFSFESNDVRVITGPDGEPWWVGADACRACGHDNPSLAINGQTRKAKNGKEYHSGGLDDDEKGIHIVNTPSGPQEMLCVNEPGLYTLILKSRKSEARRFKRWVTHEVLPAVRKTGRYEAAPEEDELVAKARYFLKLAEQQAECARRVKAIEAEAALARGEAAAADAKASVALATLLDDTRYMALVGYSSLRGLNLSRQELSNDGRKLSALCRKQGVPIKEVHSEVWGSVHAYPVPLLERYYGESDN